MDVLPRITRQLVELFRTMSLVQRVTFVAVPLLMLGGFAWLSVANRSGDFQAVSFGKAFTAEELSAAERALNQAGLTNYRRKGRKLLAPATQLDRYNAALVEFDAVPSDLGSQMLKQFESLGPFTTDRQRQEMKDALLLQELRRMIEAVPDIEHARVAVANSGRRVSFGQKPRVTANVTVKPREGRELSTRLVASLRQAVASMVPDLNSSDVTVFDVARGHAYTGEASDDPLDSRLMQRLREYTRQYEQQIQKALAFIPNASVAVHVDVDHLKSSVTRNERTHVRGDSAPLANRPASILPMSFEGEPVPHAAGFRGASDVVHDGLSETQREVSENQLLAAMPRAVQVSVSIPRDYYRDVVTRRKTSGEQHAVRLDLDFVEEEVIAKVERTVARLIPVGSPHEAISVTTVDRLPNDSPEPTLTSSEQFLVLAQRHGGSCVLCLFAAWALWMLTRLTPKLIHSAEPSSPEPIPPAYEITPPALPDSRLRAPEPVHASSILRDNIRSLAESDPATAAAVLRRWLAEAT